MHVEDRTQQEQASPAVRNRLQKSSGLEGLTSHVGARINRVGPGREHSLLPARPEVKRQHGHMHAGATNAIADDACGHATFAGFDEESEVLTAEHEIDLLAAAAGDHPEMLGTLLRPGRTLTVRPSRVYGGQADGARTVVASGLQTLIRSDWSPA
ncbi:PaaI family thioesterase [Streptomyces sp. NPDC048514]|uniref:PaaI family thioesterase n=1 Tax=Streptomyces sp. NPDC048514 TaxID=3365564 RepID=UPI0037100AC7